MISNKCYYALKAMLELARQEDQGTVSIGQIAQARRIPVRFLEAILRQLKQGRFTTSTRGKAGGYRLARPARSIMVGEVIRHFEGPLLSVSPAQAKDQEAQKGLVFKEISKKAEEALAAVYDNISFAELLERETMLNGTETVNYSI